MQVQFCFLVALLVIAVGDGSGPAAEASTEASVPKNRRDGEHHGVHVASWRFSYVKLPLILTAFMVAIVLVKVGRLLHDIITFDI